MTGRFMRVSVVGENVQNLSLSKMSSAAAGAVSLSTVATSTDLRQIDRISSGAIDSISWHCLQHIPRKIHLENRSKGIFWGNAIHCYHDDNPL